jgi:catechol 2,3-dioxygenase-like lactoylglutathione lyase family enzyme
MQKWKTKMPIAPSSLVHVVYRTRRFEEMLTWYATVFGARIQFQNPALAFLTFDNGHHRFAFADLGVIRPDEHDRDDRGMIGVDHVAWEYESLRDLLENYDELKTKGIAPYWAIHHGMSASLYYADPDGNQMEFAVDAFPTKAEAAAYFHGSQIGENPVGVEYDPDEWLAKLRRGAADSELLAFDSQGAVSPIRGTMMAVKS